MNKRHANFRHGFSDRDSKKHQPAVYIAWINMRQRCNNTKKWDYKFYGGRGIKICARWNDFKNFLDDMGKSREEHAKKHKHTTLDRVDVNGDYSPENCRWATRREQSANRNYNRKITYGGETLTISAWVDKLKNGITVKELRRRVFYRKWPLEKAFTQRQKVCK